MHAGKAATGARLPIVDFHSIVICRLELTGAEGRGPVVQVVLLLLQVRK